MSAKARGQECTEYWGEVAAEKTGKESQEIRPKRHAEHNSSGAL